MTNNIDYITSSLDAEMMNFAVKFYDLPTVSVLLLRP